MLENVTIFLVIGCCVFTHSWWDNRYLSRLTWWHVADRMTDSAYFSSGEWRTLVAPTISRNDQTTAVLRYTAQRSVITYILLFSKNILGHICTLQLGVATSSHESRSIITETWKRLAQTVTPGYSGHWPRDSGRGVSISIIWSSGPHNPLNRKYHSLSLSLSLSPVNSLSLTSLMSSPSP